MIKFNDRVKVTNPKYCCEELGALGTIVDNGHDASLSLGKRFLVRWDSNPTMLWGVHEKDIELVEHTNA